MSTNKKAKSKLQQQQQQQQQRISHYFNYRNFVSTTPALSFRMAAQPSTGLWDVYAMMCVDVEGEKKKAELILLRQPIPPEPPHCKSNEKVVTRGLRSIELANDCIRRAETCTMLGPGDPNIDECKQNMLDVDAQEIWYDFDQVVSRYRSNGVYSTLVPAGAIDKRVIDIHTQSVRAAMLERFGTVVCVKRDISAFELLQHESTVAIYVHLHSLPNRALACLLVSAAERASAEKTLEEFRIRANSQACDPTIDFTDCTPLPAEQRAAERKKFEQNAGLREMGKISSTPAPPPPQPVDVGGEDDDDDEEEKDAPAKNSESAEPAANVSSDGDPDVDGDDKVPPPPQSEEKKKKQNGSEDGFVTIGARKKSTAASDKFLNQTPLTVTMKAAAAKND